MSGDDARIYLADNRMPKPKLLSELDTINRIRNLKQYSEDSLAAIDNEGVFFFDCRNGKLRSLLVHNISKI